jgi:uncharacterized membrane protein YgdD (TMEM256/DUF423 family)
MGIITGLFLFLGGALAASSFIIEKRPDAENLINKLIPYQGWIGIALIFFGIIDLIRSFAEIDSVMFYWTISFIAAGVEIILGFLLGYNMINQFLLNRRPDFAEKGLEIRDKLVNIQIPLGITGMIIGALSFIIGLFRL